MEEFFNLYLIKGILIELSVLGLAVFISTIFTFLLNIFQAYEASLVLLVRLGCFILINLVFLNQLINFFIQGLNASLG